MSDTLETSSPASSATPEPAPPPSSFRRFITPRTVAGTVLAVALIWYLFIYDSAANNDVVEGFDVLITGFGNLPGLLFQTEAYSSWWDWLTQSEGWSAVFDHVIEHVQIVLMSMLFAVVISVALGLLIHRVAVLRGLVLGVASILLTIPSLALFAIFISIPAIGIGDRGPIIALTLYSILPILRNTVTGLEGVDAAVIESAKGMGLNARQRLVRIEFPLAWPVILTGIRVATLLNIGIAAIAVLVGGTGLGVYINNGLTRYPNLTSVERMWTGVIFTVLLALVFDLLFTLLRRFTTSKGLRS